MTFEEAMQALNRHQIAEVAAEMVKWHPVILGNMILAVAAAKKVRYLGEHPGYADPLAAALKSEARTHTAPQLLRKNTKTSQSRINMAARRLSEWLERNRGR
jgi:hypothetical protein